MKLVVAVALALSAASVLAHASEPFEQSQLDRALPALRGSATAPEPISRESLPFEQSELDRKHVGIPEYEQQEVMVAQLLGDMSYQPDEQSGPTEAGAKALAAQP